jgi:alanine racemase
MQHVSSSWVEISKQAIIHNVNQYKQIVGDAVCLAPVIKSNAYGHGIELVAKILQEHDAVDYLCVVALSEALQLRAIGITKPILVLSIIDADIAQAVMQNITIVCYDQQLIQELNSAAIQLQKKARVHIKIDTGLSRAGLLHGHAVTIITQWVTLPGITIEGIFSHFANAENADPRFTQEQIKRFNKIIHELEQHNIRIPFKHISCSAAITGHFNSHFNFARLGIGTYGLWPSSANKQITEKLYPWFSLKPALTWKTRIIQLKKIPASSFVGYDLTYQTKRETVIALLPVGYWDGYDRGFSNNGFVLVNETLAPIIGRIAMNLMMIDVTDITNCAVGTVITLLGNHSGITVDDLAASIGTINYEIVTRINPLLQRRITEI